MSGCFVRVDESPRPNRFPVVTARAVADHVVSESGYLTFTVAVPSASVLTSGSHRIVERKSLRTWTAGSCGAATSPSWEVALADGAILNRFAVRPATGSSEMETRSVEISSPDTLDTPPLNVI